jgi:hypothetical protein
MKTLRTMWNLLESLLLMAVVTLILMCGVALAQSLPSVPGVVVPDQVWYVAAVLIGLIVKAVASPLTALLKRRFGYQGNVTRLVYLVLSLLFVIGFGLATGAFGQGPSGWASAGMALLVALIKGYGDYTKLVQTSAAGTVAAGVPAEPYASATAEVLPPAGVIQPPPPGARSSGLEPIPSTTPHGLLGLPDVDLPALIADVMTAAGLASQPQAVARVALRLVAVTPDLLLDGSPYTSSQTRNLILSTVMELKRLGSLK